MNTSNNKQMHTAKLPPSEASARRSRHLTVVTIATCTLCWLLVAACPRPPASIPVEGMNLDGGRTGRTEATTDAPAPRDGVTDATETDSDTVGDANNEPNSSPDGGEPSTDRSRDDGPQDSGLEPSSEATPEQPAERTQPPEPTSCPPAPTVDTVDTLQSWKPLGFATNPQSFTLPRCQGVGFRLVAPAQMEIQVDVMGLPRRHAFALAAYNARRINKVAKDAALATQNSAAKDYISLRFKVDRSGEVGVVLYGYQHPTATPFQIQAFCTSQCQRETTRFPIVLMHGLAGTDKYFGLLDYFYGVKSHLEKQGYAVFTPKVQPVANSKTRVLTLKGRIDDIFKQTGARKLNLIAHSQGGVDGRLLISAHGYHDRIASLTTISTPHRGVPVPNVLIPPSQELGESNMKKYNQQYPNHPSVKYFSWAGVSCGLLDASCRKKYNDETIDPLLLATFQALKLARGANDGLVPVSSAKWGTFLGEIPADHWDEIGQVADRNNKSFNHKDFYLNEAKRLKKLDF